MKNLLKLLRKKLIKRPNAHKAAVSVLSEIRNGILPAGAWEEIFRARIYAALNPDLSQERTTKYHFQTSGFLELRRIHPSLKFDPNFYTEWYPDLVHFTDIEAYVHWLVYGIAERRSASGSDYLLSIGYKGSLPDYFTARKQKSETDAQIYRAFSTLIESSDALFRKFLSDHHVEALYLREMADFFIEKGDKNKAKICLEFHISAEYSDGKALHLLADLVREEGQEFSALQLYKRAKALPSASMWSTIWYSKILENYGHHRLAADEIISYYRDHSDNEFVRQRARHHISVGFDKEYENALEIALPSDFSRAQEIVRKANETMICDLRELMRSEVSSKPSKINSIAIVSHSTPRQCFRYRTEHKITQLEYVGVDVEWFDASEPQAFYSAIQKFDAVIFQRVQASPQMAELILSVQQCGLWTFYEIDDLIMDEAIYPPSFESMGGLVSQDQYVRLALDAIMCSQAAKLCEFGVGSTEPITLKLKELVKNSIAFTHRNGFVEKDYALLSDELSKNEQVNAIEIVYGSGGRSHTGNFYAGAADAIFEVMNRRGNVYLHIIGDLTLDERFLAMNDRIRRTPNVGSFQAYIELLNQADINIAPLEPSAFSDAKSEIKWIEASLVGIPSVVSRNDTFHRLLNDGEDGFICNTPDEWLRALSQLVDDKKLRSKMARAACDRVTKAYDAEKLGHSFIDSAHTAIRASISASCFKKKHRLAIVNVFFAPNSYGGATRVVETIAFGAADINDEWEVEVFTSLPDNYRPGTVERYSAGQLNVTAVASGQRDNLGIKENDIYIGAAFAQFLDRFKPHVINVHCIQRLTASILDEAYTRDIPVVISIHDGWWLSDHQFLIESNGELVTETGNWGDAARISRLLRALKQADVIIAPSKAFADMYHKHGIKPVNVIENPIANLAAAAPPNAGPLCVGLLGGFGIAKGADLLKQVLLAKKFRNLTFLFIDHTASSGYEQRQSIGGNDVIIIGKVAQNSVVDVYNRLNIVCVPSVCIESFGLVAREAISLGRWVIVSDRGGLPECVTPGVNGMIIDVSDISGLLESLNIIDLNTEKYRYHNHTALDANEKVNFLFGYYSVFSKLIKTDREC